MSAASLEIRYPHRATTWKLRTRTLALAHRPLLMGILNVTPDSFSDGGHFFAPELAIRRAEQLLDEGADILDIGGESTRPYAAPVSADDELQRVLPVVMAIAQRRPQAILSIDTSKAVVAQAALAAGAEIVNDISGLTSDPQMIHVARDSGAGICAMHMQGMPQTMQDDPRYGDVVAEVRDYLRDRFEQLAAAGIERARICLDPGIGFGKTHQHNLTLMAHAGELHSLGQPLLFGHSRKGFLGKVLGDKAAPRTFAGIGAALALARQGVQILRVHDIVPLRQALLLFDACGGLDH
jgi:dihydropteroate synthase